MSTGIHLVTGGGGFIGRHLVEQLTERGERVRVLDTNPSAAPFPDNVEVQTGTILDQAQLTKAMRGVSHVYHLAANPNLWARDKSTFQTTNVEGTKRVLDAIEKSDVTRVVYTSTESILRGIAQGTGPINEDINLPNVDEMPGAYCKSKYLAERAAFDAAANGLPVMIVNPTMPIGPGDHKLTPPMKMLADFVSGRIPAFLECQLNLVDVRDAARGHILAMENGQVGERYILGGTNIWMHDLLQKLENISGQPMPTRRVPYWLALVSAAINETFSDLITKKPPQASLPGVQLVRQPLIFETAKAERELGYMTRPIDASIRDAVDWLRLRANSPNGRRRP